MTPTPPLPPPPVPPPPVSPLAWLWIRRRTIAASAGVLLAVICPFMPPVVQGPCAIARTGIQIAQRVLEQLGPPPCETVQCDSIGGPAYTVHQPDGGDCGCQGR